LIKTIRLIYLTNTLKSRDSRSLMHAENSYEMPKYFTRICVWDVCNTSLRWKSRQLWNAKIFYTYY